MNDLEKYVAGLTGGKFGLLDGVYTTSQQVPCEKQTYGFIAINSGGDAVRVNGIRLKPFPPGFPQLSGESFGFVDPWRNTYNRDFTITFEGTGSVPSLTLVQVYKTN